MVNIQLGFQFGGTYMLGVVDLVAELPLLHNPNSPDSVLVHLLLLKRSSRRRGKTSRIEPRLNWVKAHSAYAFVIQVQSTLDPSFSSRLNLASNR